MEKRTIIAIALIAVIWVVWLLIFPNQNPSQQQTPSKKTIEQNKVESKETGKADVVISSQNQEEKTIHVSTDKYDVELTNYGAQVKQLTYKARNVKLVVPQGKNSTGYLDFAISLNNEDFLQGSSLSKTNWSFQKDANGKIRFFTTILINGNPVKIEKIFHFSDNKYFFNLEYKISNTGSENVTFQNDTIIISPGDMLGPALDFSNVYNQLSSIFYLNEDFNKGSKQGGFFSSNDDLGRETGNVGWFGIMSRYFLIIMIPDGFTGNGIIYDRRENTGYRTGVLINTNVLRAGTAITRSFRVYVGEKNKDFLAAVERSLIDAADISKWIEPIRYFVLWCLLSINRYIGNIGWSLVIFSLLTKIVFTPLTMKSMDSMKRLQKLTPKLNELKAKYKDKPEVMQREMMKLYKENKVNPLGGCFPLLLQMPFFFALYSALIDSIDLWNASYIFWIRDLSMPDTIATIAGFNINILPIIMTATSFIQQKMSSVETGPQQKMMIMIMPVVLLFIFWNMPSGLVLYWSLQNIFQIVHQLIINKFGKKEA